MRSTRGCAIVMTIALTVSDAMGCAVCFGDPNSAMTRGAEAGILVLLGVIGSLLMAIIGMIIFWTRRARHLTQTQNAIAFPSVVRT